MQELRLVPMLNETIQFMTSWASRAAITYEVRYYIMTLPTSFLLIPTYTYTLLIHLYFIVSIRSLW
jgi:hypothetical protein